MTRREFENIIAFCILMQDGNGIMAKYPRYVIDCFERREHVKLDTIDTHICHQYMHEWKDHIPKFEG